MNTSSLFAHISFSSSLTFLFLVGGFWNVIDHNEMATLSLFSIGYMLGTCLGHRFFRFFSNETNFNLFFAYLSGALLGSGILILRYTIYFFELRAGYALLLIFVGAFLSAASGWLNAFLRPPKHPLDRPAYIISYFIFTTLPYVFLSISLHLGFQKTALLSSTVFMSLTALLAGIEKKKQPLKEISAHFIPILIILPILWILERDLNQITPQKGPLRLVSEVFGAHKKYVLAEEDAVGPLKLGPPQHIFYIDGVEKFTSEWEQLDNQCLVSFPIQLMQSLNLSPERVLIIGGGDGLAARNVLQFSSVKSVKILESDGSIYKVARDDLKMRIYNLDSLKSPRTELIEKDIFWWVDHEEALKFDLIILDLPVPTEVSTMRLLSAEFLKRLLDLTSDEGAIVSKAGPLRLFEKQDGVSPAVYDLKATWMRLGQDPMVYTTQSESTAFQLILKDREKNNGRLNFKSPQCRIAHISQEPTTSSYTLNTLHLKSQFVDNIFSRGFSGERFIFLPH